MNNTKLKLSDYVVLDVETPNRKNDSVCQIGILQVKNNKIVYEKSKLINPEVKINICNLNSTINNQKLVVALNKIR